MEAGFYACNPLWIEALAGEKEIAPLHNKRSDNNWKKGLLSIAIIGLLLGVLGVPVYGLVTSAGSSVIPFNFANENTQIKAFSSNVGTTGDLIDYELTHWGAKPSVALLGDIISDAFSDVGLEAAFYFVLGGAGIEDAAGLILAAGILSDSAVATALLAFMSSPLGWGVMIFYVCISTAHKLSIKILQLHYL